eukprot:m.266001 g.266001  ORF g.266001 m.266001 type:complete len:122 (+) comp64836_c0_seq1:396-761(+)
MFGTTSARRVSQAWEDPIVHPHLSVHANHCRQKSLFPGSRDGGASGKGGLPVVAVAAAAIVPVVVVIISSYLPLSHKVRKNYLHTYRSTLVVSLRSSVSIFCLCQIINLFFSPPQAKPAKK